MTCPLPVEDVSRRLDVRFRPRTRLDSMRHDRSLVSEDGRTALDPARSRSRLRRGTSSDSSRPSARSTRRRATKSPPPGSGSSTWTSRRRPRQDLIRGEVLGLTAALIILALRLRLARRVAGPARVAIVSIVVALGLTTLVGQAWRALLLRREHARDDGPRGRGRLLALRRLALSRGAQRRGATSSPRSPRRRDVEPGRVFSGLTVVDRADRDVPRPAHRLPQPRRRRDRRRARLGRGRAHAACRRCSRCSATASTRCGSPLGRRTGRRLGAHRRGRDAPPGRSLAASVALLLALAAPYAWMRTGELRRQHAAGQLREQARVRAARQRVRRARQHRGRCRRRRRRALARVRAAA